MPTCRICQKTVSILRWDLLRGTCAACRGVPVGEIRELQVDPCRRCGGDSLYATTAPAMTYIYTRYGPQATKVAAGLYLVACSDCGHVCMMFSQRGAAALTDAPGWLPCSVQEVSPDPEGQELD